MSLVCPHRPPCPGCPALGRTGWPRAAAAALGALAAEAGIGLPPLRRGAPSGFRRRARLAIRGRARSPKVGIFAAGSHRVVHVPRCLVHHPVVNEVAAALTEAMRRTGTAPYSDDAHLGLARYVQIVVERGADRAQVVLVGNTEAPEALAPLGAALGELAGDRLHSLWLNGNPGKDNAILGPHWHHVSGPDAIRETVAGADVFYPPDAFGQSNGDLADELATWVHARTPEGCRVVELYAGSGAIGLGLVRASVSVTFNEIAPGGLRGLALGVAALPAPLRERARLRPGPAREAVDTFDQADVVIADPPRKGLEPAVVEALAATPPSRLVYVACGLEAFLRDARSLSGALRLVELGAFDLFAHTEHLEVVGVFDQR